MKTSLPDVDRALAVLSASKVTWAALDITKRIALLEQIERDLPAVEERWVAAALTAKGGAMQTMAEGEEHYNIGWTYRYLRILRQSLTDIARFGKPRIPGKLTTRANGQVVAQVVPYDWKDRLALLGIRAEVWMDSSVSLHNGGIPQASFYQGHEQRGRVCAILGAGNTAMLVPGDFLYKLFVEGQVVALKMNPVNEYLGPLFEQGFAALVNAGFLQILYGGVLEGSYLCNHPSVEDVHVTGAERTFNAIVFGTGIEGEQRRQARAPLFTKKQFTAELGNISPVIVVPGPWTDEEVQAQAVRLGSWLVPNAAHNCVTPRMLIQMKGWRQRELLNQRIAAFLERIEPRKAYYPGSAQLYQQFLEAHPEAKQLGKPKSPEQLPWTFIQNVDSQNSDDICFTREPFMSLFSETGIEAKDPVEFLEKAVNFANNKLWGTLAVSLMVHPVSLQDPEVAAAVDRAIADLRYGSVVINYWGLLAYATALTPWGGYQNTDVCDVQSGIGFVNNPLMFERVQKSVVYSPFTPLVDPFLVNLPDNYRYLRNEKRFQRSPTLGNLGKMLWSAVSLKQAR